MVLKTRYASNMENPPSLSISVKVHGSTCGSKQWNPENQNPNFHLLYMISIKKETKAKLPCLVWGTPHPVAKTATWHLGSDTTISGDITCKDKICVWGSANANNNIQPTKDLLDSETVSNWFVINKNAITGGNLPK